MIPVQIATSVNDAGGKFAIGVNDTGGKQWEQLSDCWQLKVNLKKKIYLDANSATQKCPKENWLIIFMMSGCYVKLLYWKKIKTVYTLQLVTCTKEQN